MAVMEPKYVDGILSGDFTEEQMLERKNNVTAEGNGGGAVIHTGGLDDKVTVKAGASNYGVTAGDGNNTILAESGSKVNDITTGAGIDKITVNANATAGSIDAGAGNNVFTINGIVTGSIKSGAGADKITVGANGKVGSMDLGAGNNTITVSGPADSKIAEIKAIGLETNTNKITINAPVEVESIVTGSSKDTIAVKGKVNNIDAGAGDDTITVSGGTNLSVATGAGNDKLTVEMDKITGDVTIDLGAEGKDIVTIKGIKVTDFNSVSKEDGALVLSNATRTLTIKNWDTNGLDSLTFADGKKGKEYFDTWYSLRFAKAEGTAAADKIEINGEKYTIGKFSYGLDPAVKSEDGHGFEVYAKDGNDTIKVTGGKDILVKAGAGVDNITVSAGNGHEIFAEADNDKITVTGGSEMLIDAGDGDDTININGGSDINLYTGAGNDKINIDASKYSGDIYVDLGSEGKDTLTIKGIKVTDFNSIAKDDGNLILSNADRDVIIDNWEKNGIDALTFGDGKKGREYFDTWYSLRYAKAEGTTAADKIEINGEKYTIGKFSYGLDPSVKSADGYGFEVYAKDGNDTIKVTGGKDILVKAGAGVDNITVSAGNGHEIFAEADNDKITVTGGSEMLIDAGDGDDTININGGSDINLYTGAGNDKINIDASKYSGDIYVDLGSEGKDTLTIKGIKVTDFNSIAKDDGNLILSNADRDVIIDNWEKNGIDALTFGDGKKGKEYFDTWYSLRYAKAEGTAAADKIEVDGEKYTIGKFSYGLDPAVTSEAGYGFEVYAKDGNDTIKVSGGKNILVDAGEGVDNITVSAGSGHEIKAGAANDVINITGGTGLEVNGEAGEDTININGGSGITVDGGAGKDKINIDWSKAKDITIVVDSNDIDTITVKNAKLSDFALAYDGEDMVLTDKSGNTITFQGWENWKDTESEDYDKDPTQAIIFGSDKYNWDFINDLANNAINGSTAADVITVDGSGATISATVGKNTYTLPKNGEAGNAVAVGGREGNDTLTISGLDRAVVGGGDGVDKIIVKSINQEAIIAGNDGNDAYTVDWSGLKGFVIVRNDNNDDGDTVQEKDTLELSNVKSTDVKFVKTTVDIGDDDEPEIVEAIKIYQEGKADKYVAITHWAKNENPLASIKFSDKTLNTDDIFAKLEKDDPDKPDPGPEPEVKTEILSEAKAYGEHFFKDVETGTLDGYTLTMQKGTASFIAPVAIEENGTATNNTVNVEAGAKLLQGTGDDLQGHVRAAYVANGTAEGNTANLNGGTVEGEFIAAEMESGEAKGNTVNINSGSARIVGGALGVKVNASGNTVSVKGGTVEEYVYGGATVVGTATENVVNVGKATVDGTVFGGRGIKPWVEEDMDVTPKANAVDNKVVVNGGITNGDIFGGFAVAGDAIGNSVELTNVQLTNNKFYFDEDSKQWTDDYGYAYGGRVKGTGNATGNSVTLNSGEVLVLRGGRTDSGIASENVVNVKGGTLSVIDYQVPETNNTYGVGCIEGARTTTGKVENNTVNITGGTLKGDIRGARVSESGSATGNAVNISSGTINASKVIGAYANTSQNGSANGGLTANTVTITGGTFAEKTNIYGAYNTNGKANGNTVTLENTNIGANKTIEDLYSIDEQGHAMGVNNYAEQGVLGGFTRKGSADNNIVNISGNSTVVKVAGGSSDSASASGNTVTLGKGVTVKTNVEGGVSRGSSAAANNNSVVIDGAIVVGNMVLGTDGTDDGGIVTGGRANGTVNNNEVLMKAGTVDYIRAARSNNGVASGNKLEITGGTVNNSAIGAYTSAGTASQNTVTITGGVVNGYVAGGRTKDGEATDNHVILGGNAVLKSNVYTNRLDKDGVGTTGTGSVIVNDSAKVEGTIVGGMGVDTITVNSGTVAAIDGGAGNDIIEVKGGSVGTITAGAGNDTISIDWSKVQGNMVVNQTNAASDVDSLSLTGAKASDFTFALSGTSLVLTDANSKNLTINGWKNGFDKINIGGTVVTEADMGLNTIDPVDPPVEGASLTVDFTTANVVTITAAELAGKNITTLQMADSSIYLNDCYAQANQDGDLELRFVDDNDETIGILVIEDASATQIEKIVAGTKTLNLVKANETKNFVGTDATEGYIFVDKGWNITVDGGMTGNDALHLGAMRDARVVRYNTTKDGNDLKLEALYYDDNDVEHTYGNITLKDYFADKDGNGVYDGNETKNRILSSYKGRQSSDFTTTWSRMYMDYNEAGINFNVKDFMASVGERTEHQDNLSARGIFMKTGAGNDTIVAGEGRDYIMTGGGNDTVYVHNHHYEGVGTDGNPVFDSSFVSDQSSQNARNQIFTGAGDDSVYIGDYDVTADSCAKSNNNWVRTGDGNDYVNIRGDFNDVNTGADNDTIWVRGGNNRVNGYDGDDKIILWSSGTNQTSSNNTSGNNYIRGGAGNDTLLVRRGSNETVSGGTGNDTYFVQWNRANNLKLDNLDAATADKDTLVLAGISEANMSTVTFAVADGVLVISGQGQNGETTNNNTLRVSGWDVSDLGIKLLDVSANKTYEISSSTLKTAMSSLGEAALSFADISSTATAGIDSVDQENLTTLKITGNN